MRRVGKKEKQKQITYQMTELTFEIQKKKKIVTEIGN